MATNNTYVALSQGLQVSYKRTLVHSSEKNVLGYENASLSQLIGLLSEHCAEAPTREGFILRFPTLVSEAQQAAHTKG